MGFYNFVHNKPISDEDVVMQAGGTTKSMLDKVAISKETGVVDTQDEVVVSEAMQSTIYTTTSGKRQRSSDFFCTDNESIYLPPSKKTNENQLMTKCLLLDRMNLNECMIKGNQIVQTKICTD